jgi:hypothetical protein
LGVTISDEASYYLKAALLLIAVIVSLVAAYRVWEELHDVEEPDSPDDLLASFEQARAEGALNDQELDRVRQQLRLGEAKEPAATTRSDSLEVNPLEDLPSGREGGPALPEANEGNRNPP